MALSATEQTQLKALFTREGGLQAFSDQVYNLYVSDRQANAQTALSGAISVSVSDWAAIAAYVGQASNVTLYSVLDAITAAAVARDATKLGPLLVALYAAIKAHFGK